MADPISRPTTFRHPPVARRIGYCTAIGLPVIGFALWKSSPVSLGEVTIAILFFLGFAALVLWLNLHLHLSEVRLDERGIAQRFLLHTRMLRWAEVEDCVSSSRLLLLYGPQRKPEIGVLRNDVGLSLEPFEEMRELILARVQPRLWEQWSAISLREGRSYPHPPFSLPQGFWYVVVGCVIAYPFVVAPLQMGLFGWEQALYLAASCLGVAPFLVRDLRKTRRRIMLREDGVRESNGRTTFLPWDEVAQITLREPIFGLGSVVVTGKHGKRLTFSLRMRGCGELFFLLRTRSGAEITYGFEHWF